MILYEFQRPLLGKHTDALQVPGIPSASLLRIRHSKFNSSQKRYKAKERKSVLISEKKTNK